MDPLDAFKPALYAQRKKVARGKWPYLFLGNNR